MGLGKVSFKQGADLNGWAVNKIVGKTFWIHVMRNSRCEDSDRLETFLLKHGENVRSWSRQTSEVWRADMEILYIWWDESISLEGPSETSLPSLFSHNEEVSFFFFKKDRGNIYLKGNSTVHRTKATFILLRDMLQVQTIWNSYFSVFQKETF